MAKLLSISQMKNNQIAKNLYCLFFFIFINLLTGQRTYSQVNLALGKTVTSSSTAAGSSNSNLVDGDFSTVASTNNTQTGTNAEWFLVDLGADYYIDHVTIGSNTANPQGMRRFMIVSWPSAVAGPAGLGIVASTYVSTNTNTSLYNRLSYQLGTTNNPSVLSNFDVKAAGLNVGPVFTNNQFSFNYGIHKARYVLLLNLQRAAFDPAELQVFQTTAGSVREFVNGGFELQTSSGVSMTPEETINGWSTTEAVGHFEATDQPINGGFIEIWRDNSTNGGAGIVRSRTGNYFAELSAFENAELDQQPICVLAGETFNWTFAHRGRFGEDVMALRINDVDVAQFRDNNARGESYRHTFSCRCG